MGKRPRTTLRRTPTRGLPKSKRADELPSMPDSDNDEIDACKMEEL